MECKCHILPPLVSHLKLCSLPPFFQAEFDFFGTLGCQGVKLTKRSARQGVVLMSKKLNLMGFGVVFFFLEALHLFLVAVVIHMYLY